MAHNQKEQTISISFHSIKRLKENGEDKEEVNFSDEDFNSLIKELQEVQVYNFGEEKHQNAIRFRRLVKFDRLERDGRFLFGVFRNSYWGHSFENSEKGEISAESLNYRPFFFLIYHSDNGALFIGAQYLGLYGGWQPLRNTITDRLVGGKELSINTFHKLDENLGDASAQEVSITYYKKSDNIAADNTIGSSGVIVLKKTDNAGIYDEEVKRRLLPGLGRDRDETAALVKSVLEDTKLYEIEDLEIEDCKILFKIGKRKKKVSLFGTGEDATRFVVDVELEDGHPKFEDMKKEAIVLLKSKIIEFTA